MSKAVSSNPNTTRRRKNNSLRFFLSHPSHNGYHQEGKKNTFEDMGKKETFIHCWWECKLVQPLWKSVWRFLKELKTELPI
jgi:hypothetical protein